MRYDWQRICDGFDLSRLAGAQGAFPDPVADETLIVDASSTIVLVELAFDDGLVSSHATVPMTTHR